MRALAQALATRTGLGLADRPGDEPAPRSAPAARRWAAYGAVSAFLIVGMGFSYWWAGRGPRFPVQVGATTVVNRRFGDALVRSFSVSEGPTVWQFGNASAHTTSGWTHPYPATFDVVNAGPRPAALRLVVGSAKDWTTWYTTVQTGTLAPGQAGRVTVSLGGHGGVPAEIFLR